MAEIEPQTNEPVKAYDTFDEMNLPDNLLRGVYAHGFERPSAIQQIGIMPMKDGRDLLAQARSGTGKTGTFTIGALSRIDPALNETQVLVLAPVREIADMIRKVATSLGSYMKTSVYGATGGTPLREDLAALKKGVQFLVGTPGRIFDLATRGALSFRHVRVLIMDEADQMLENRFQEQVMAILKLGFPSQTRVALFSATMPPDVVEFANQLLNNPVRILVPEEEVTLEGIQQYYVELENEDWKFDVLCDIYSQLPINQAIIYCNKRQKAEWLAHKMKEANFTLEYIHGDMEVSERKKRMDDFMRGSVRVLIATDMLARGIDNQQLSLVINFELPVQKENYIHRIGRSGRYGRKGTAINICGPQESKDIRVLESHYATKIHPLPENLGSLTL